MHTYLSFTIGHVHPIPVHERNTPMRKRSLSSILFLLLLLTLVLVPAALADSPHFVRASATLSNNGNLTVAFKEAGLGANQNITYMATADATATYACRNRGGNWPQDPKKTVVSGPVSATGTFSSGRNGQITASLTLMPPPTTLTCPGGQTRVLADVSYSNVAVTDTTNNVSQSIAGTYSRVFFVLP